MTVRFLPPALAAACLVGAFVLLSVVPAAADLRFCNQTKSQIGVAIGYRNKSGWITEGWFNLGPQVCETIQSGPLVTRYYYFHAVDYDHGGEWGGTATMCTHEKEFTIQGIDKCVERGFEAKGFMEVDVREHRNWTIQLTEPAERSTSPQ